MRASVAGFDAVAEVRATPDTNLKIRIEDSDFGNQRYKMTNNVLEIAARHE